MKSPNKSLKVRLFSFATLFMTTNEEPPGLHLADRRDERFAAVISL
jgi:hypothetical protein